LNFRCSYAIKASLKRSPSFLGNWIAPPPEFVSDAPARDDETSVVLLFFSPFPPAVALALLDDDDEDDAFFFFFPLAILRTSALLLLFFFFFSRVDVMQCREVVFFSRTFLPLKNA
jgi:hypothetical protein